MYFGEVKEGNHVYIDHLYESVLCIHFGLSMLLVCKAHCLWTLVYEAAKNDSSMPTHQMIVSGLMKTLFGKVKIY